MSAKQFHWITIQKPDRKNNSDQERLAPKGIIGAEISVHLKPSSQFPSAVMDREVFRGL